MVAGSWFYVKFLARIGFHFLFQNASRFFREDYLFKIAPVVQRTEQIRPKDKIEVQFLSGALNL